MATPQDESNIAGKSNSAEGSKHKDSVTLSRPTFYKIVIVGIIGLMISAFFAGYNLHDITDQVTYVTLPQASTPLPMGQLPNQLAPAATPESFPATPESMLPSMPISVKNITLGDSPFLGQAEAKVVLVEYSDFQCPFCASFFSNALSEIKKEYVDSGKIKFVYKHLPLEFHPNAKPAAIASECAHEQGSFWPYHDALFNNQNTWQNLTPNQTNAEFVKYAINLGLNVDNFSTCINSNKYEQKINNDILQGSTLGATGTPTFFVGNEETNYTSIEGAQPFQSFKQIIDSKLS